MNRARPSWRRFVKKGRRWYEPVLRRGRTIVWRAGHGRVAAFLAVREAHAHLVARRKARRRK